MEDFAGLADPGRCSKCLGAAPNRDFLQRLDRTIEPLRPTEPDTVAFHLAKTNFKEKGASSANQVAYISERSDDERGSMDFMRLIVVNP